MRRTTRVQLTSGANILADYGTGYDDAGNRTYLQRNHLVGNPADVYQYDTLYQLTQAWYDADATDPGTITTYGDLQTYTLDTVGNRLEVASDDGSGPTTQNYGPHDTQQLTNSMNRYQTVDGNPLSYDPRGNTLADGVTANSYGYDVLNRQTDVSNADADAGYVYDAMGRRVAKTVTDTAGVTTTYFLYDKRFRVIEERSDETTWIARYTYGSGIDEPLMMERGGSRYYLHRDALGSITEVTDESGNLVERYEYDVYGTPEFYDGGYNAISESAIGNPYLFTGRRYDPESGNYYYRARIYSPALGRFLSMDPLGYEAGDANLYRYVFNNPVNAVDPSGKCIGLLGGVDTVFCVMVVGAVIGVGIDLAVQLGEIYLDRGTLDGLDIRNDIDWTSVGVSAAAGAASGGLGVGVSAFKSLALRMGLNAVGSASIGGIATYAEKYFKDDWECNSFEDRADVIVTSLVSGALGFFGSLADEAASAAIRGLRRVDIDSVSTAYYNLPPGGRNIVDTTRSLGGRPHGTVDIWHIFKNMGTVLGLTVSNAEPIVDNGT